MKTGFVLLIFVLMLGTSGCCWDCDCDHEFQYSGIEGTIMYGEGECMPVIVEEDREYEEYNGTVYFVLRSALDSLGENDFGLIREISLRKEIRDGKLNAQLPPETYVIMTEEFYSFTPENTVTISCGEWVEQDFKFWQCTSY
mgnify:FL=1